MRNVDTAKPVLSLVLLGLLVTTVTATAGKVDNEKLAECARIEDGQARLSCYDAAVGRHGAPRVLGEPVQADPNDEPADTSLQVERAQLSEDVGKEQLDAEYRESEKAVAVRASVTKCSEGPTGKWYFYFDNGQVWQQKGSDRLRFKECSFDVTITKDFFGYKMQLSEDDRKIRIGRVR